MPPRPEDILNVSIKIFKEQNDNVFLVTEDLSYFEIFKDYFNDRLIFLDTPRSKCSMFGDHNIHFKKIIEKSSI